MFEQLKVSWLLKFPYVQPKKWHKWPPVNLKENRDNLVSKLEEISVFPEGTGIILKKAFELGLDRFQGWELDNVSSMEGAYVAASKIFKRGVACKRMSGERVSFEKKGTTILRYLMTVSLIY